MMCVWVCQIFVLWWMGYNFQVENYKQIIDYNTKKPVSYEEQSTTLNNYKSEGKYIYGLFT